MEPFVSLNLEKLLFLWLVTCLTFVYLIKKKRYVRSRSLSSLRFAGVLFFYSLDMVNTSTLWILSSRPLSLIWSSKSSWHNLSSSTIIWIRSFFTPKAISTNLCSSPHEQMPSFSVPFNSAARAYKSVSVSNGFMSKMNIVFCGPFFAFFSAFIFIPVKVCKNLR